MSNNNDPSILPMFPLGLVAYPGVALNLHIFEPRYRELIEDCDQGSLTFGIPTVIENQLQNIGTEMKLVSIDKIYGDGRMDVKTIGVRLFEIQEFYNVKSPKQYGAAEVVFIESDNNGDEELYDTLIEQINVLFVIFDINKTLPSNDSDLNTYKLVTHAGLNIEQEIEFVSILSEVERQLFLINHLNIFIPKAQEMEEMRKKIQLNGHFRHLIPPNLGGTATDIE